MEGMMLFAVDDPVTVPVWVRLLLDAGALGLLAIIIWQMPRMLDRLAAVLDRTLERLGEGHSKAMQSLTEQARLERDGFEKRTQQLIQFLDRIGREMPLLTDKVEKMKCELHEQTQVLKEWPSDPDKVCKASARLDKLENIIVEIMALLKTRHHQR